MREEPQSDRAGLLSQLDEELLKGGVIISEWCTFLIRESDKAFEAGAYLAAILTAMSAIETFLRSEIPSGRKMRLVDLISASGEAPEFTDTLNDLRVYRNRWVHVNEPWNDEELLNFTGDVERELESKAFTCVRALRQLVYSNQWA
jgi:hypothetical protein